MLNNSRNHNFEKSNAITAITTDSLEVKKAIHTIFEEPDSLNYSNISIIGDIDYYADDESNSSNE